MGILVNFSTKNLDSSIAQQRELLLVVMKTVSIILKKAETREDLTLLFEKLSTSVLGIFNNIHFSSTDNEIKKEVNFLSAAET